MSPEFIWKAHGKAVCRKWAQVPASRGKLDKIRHTIIRRPVGQDLAKRSHFLIIALALGRVKHLGFLKSTAGFHFGLNDA